jgi:hypothetical protein
MIPIMCAHGCGAWGHGVVPRMPRLGGRRAGALLAGALALGAAATARGVPAVCLASGDGYLRAHLAGAMEARINWRNQGTQCEGESKDTPPGVRMSFKRVPAQNPDLLFVFGLSGVSEGRPAREVATNLTVIVQGTDRIYGTLGDSRCTVDSLTQRRLDHGEYRIEARGFCTQPAHAVRGEGDVLVSTFEFAGRVSYEVPKEEETLFPQGDRDAGRNAGHDSSAAVNPSTDGPNAAANPSPANPSAATRPSAATTPNPTRGSDSTSGQTLRQER